VSSPAAIELRATVVAAPLLALALAGCSSGGATPAPAASASSLQTQLMVAANPSVTGANLPMTEEMFEAQLLCTTGLDYRPCGLVAAGDTVSCFMLCQAQIAAGATNLLARGVQDCVGHARLEGDAASPSCEFHIADDSPVDVAQLRAACNVRCRELQADGGAVAEGGPPATP
jgi:hypothetical protein